MLKTSSVVPNFSSPSAGTTDTAHQQRAEGNLPGAKVAYPYNPKTGDPKGNEYATQLQSVMKSAVIDAAASRKAAAAFMHQLRPSSQASATASSPQPELDDVDVAVLAYNKIYLEGARALEKTLQAQGMKLPRRIAKGELSYVDDAEMRAREIYFTDLARADGDRNVPKTRKEIRNRLGEERELIKYRNLQNYAKAKLAVDTAKLMDLFEHDRQKDGVHLRLKLTTPENLDRFFQDNFGVTLERRERRESNAALATAGTDANPRKAAMEARLDLFLAKIPFGRKQGDDAGPRKSIYDLAMDASHELFSARQFANSSNLSAFALRGGSSFVVKGGADEGYDFKLSQPYGQKDGKPCHYELLFTTAPDGKRALTLHRLLRGQQTPEVIGLDAPGMTREQVLAQYFHKDDLALLQGSDATLGAKDFADLYARLAVHSLIENKVEDIVYQHTDAAIRNNFSSNRIVGVQGTGFSYNNGLYGENLSVDSRTVFMMRLFKLCEQGKLAAAGSCGFQQDLIWRQRGAITALQYVTKENYLVSPHGNDPFTVEEKTTVQSVRPNTARAAEYETPWKIEAIEDPLALRRATPGKPVPQTKAFPLKRLDVTEEARGKVQFETNGEVHMNGAVSGLSEIENATSRNLWTPREYAPLAIPLAMKVPQRDPDTGASRFDQKTGVPLYDITTRHFQFMQGNTPVMASGNLVLSAAFRSEGGGETRVAIKEGDDLDKDALSTYSRLELVHELPKDWALQDDEGRIIRDRDNDYEPVRLLEKVIVEPFTVSRNARVLRMENGNPVYLDANNTPVFLRRDAATGKPLTDNEGGYLYAGINDNPAQGSVRPQFTDEKREEIQFRIAGIERWVRTPIEDKSKPGGVKTKGDVVLCTYKKVMQAGAEVDTAILQDNVYTLINCVHTQNGANTAHQDMTPVDIVAHSWKPGDERDEREHILVTSRDGRDSHPIAAAPNKPSEHRIVEGAEMNLGAGTVVVTHQPHSDMLREEGGIRANPYTVEPFGHDIDPQHAGQRQGNKQAVVTGLVLEDIGRNRDTLNTKVEDAVKARYAANAQDIAKAYALLQGDLAKRFHYYAESRHPVALEELAQALEKTGNPVLIDAAARLKHQGEHIERMEAALNDMATYIDTLPESLLRDLYAKEEIATLLDTLQQNTVALREFVATGGCTQEVKYQKNGQDTVVRFPNVGVVTTASAKMVDEIERVAHAATNLGSGEFKKHMKQLQSASAGLQHWEDAPRQILRNAEDRLRDQTKLHAIEGGSMPAHDSSRTDDLVYELFAGHNDLKFGSEGYLTAKAPILDELERRQAYLKGLLPDTGSGFNSERAELARITRVLEDWSELAGMPKLPATTRISVRQAGRPSSEQPQDLIDRLVQELSTLIKITPPDQRQRFIAAAVGELVGTGALTVRTGRTQEKLVAELTRLFDSGQLPEVSRLFNQDEHKPILKAIDALKKIELTPTPIEQVMQELSMLVASAPRDKRRSFITAAVTRLVETGLLSVGSGRTEEQLIADLTRLFESQEFSEVSSMFNQVQDQGATIHQALGALKTLEQELLANSRQDNDLPGRSRFMRPYPARGRTAAPGFPAIMATPAAIDGAIALVESVLEKLGHVSAHLATAAGGTATALEAFPGGTTIAAGVGMVKDAVFKHKRLKGMKPVYERALREHRAIETELRGIQQQLQTALDGRKSASAAANTAALDKIMKALLGRVDALQARLTTIDHELTRAAIDAASGVSLAAAGGAGLGSAIAKTSAAKIAGAISAKAAGAAAADMGLVSGIGLTLLGAAQLGLNIHDYMALSELVKNINGTTNANRLMKDTGLGEDSGLRRAQNIRIQELKDDQLRKIGLWATFTGGSMMLVAGGAVGIATHGVAAPVAAGLALAGGIMIAGSVYYLYVQPRSMRGRGGRAADDMTHTRGGFLTTEKRSNRLLHNLNNQAGIAANAVSKIVENSFDEKDRYSSGTVKQFRDTFKTLATRRVWALNDIHRKTLQSMLANDPDAAVGYRFDAMLHSNIQELNYARFEVAEREAEIRDIRTQVERYANIGLTIEELKKEIGDLEAGVADEEALKAKRDELKAAQELKKVAPDMLAGISALYAKLEPELKLARDRQAAIEDLQRRLDEFVPERGRALRGLQGDSTRDQFEDLLLRYLVAHDYLPDAMSRGDMRRFAQEHQDSRITNATLPKLMKAKYDGRVYDGNTGQGNIPAKAKLERVQFNLDPATYDQTIDWLKKQQLNVHDLYAKVLCSCLPDRCSAERNVVNDAYTEKLLKRLAQEKRQVALQPEPASV